MSVEGLGQWVVLGTAVVTVVTFFAPRAFLLE